MMMSTIRNRIILVLFFAGLIGCTYEDDVVDTQTITVDEVKTFFDEQNFASGHLENRSHAALGVPVDIDWESVEVSSFQGLDALIFDVIFCSAYVIKLLKTLVMTSRK